MKKWRKDLFMFQKIIRRSILILILVITVVYLFSNYSNKEYSRDNLEEYVTKMCEIYDVPGLSAAVTDGEEEFFINYGIKIDEYSRFELASTTKAFTALGVLKLEKEGRLRLSDNVSDYLPWFQPTFNGEVAEISIENLLCHTSGVPVWTISTIPEGDGKELCLLERTIKNIKDVKLDSQPGTVHEYATINYDILGLIIEVVTGEKYEDYITAEVLTPLQMNESFFRTDFMDGKKAVQGYKVGFFLPLKFDAPTYYGNTAAGYLVSSTSDLMKWIKFWENEGEGTEFSDIVKRTLNKDVSQTDNYFAGWNIYDDYMCHGGNNPNFSSQVIISRDGNKGVFVLSSLAGASATKIADGIYRILIGEKLKIGFQIDYNGLFDLGGIIVILIACYLSLLFYDKKSMKVGILKVAVSAVALVLEIVVPIVIRYPYRSTYVWAPITVLLAMIVIAVLALINLGMGIITVKRGHRKSGANSMG